MRALLLSDFNVDPLRTCLSLEPEGASEPNSIEATCAPFGSVLQCLSSKDAEAWRSSPELAVVWTRPEAVIDSFRAALQFEPIELSTALAEVDSFTEALIRASDWVGTIFVASWTTPTYHRGYGLLELRSGIGHADLLSRMNLRLVDNLSSTPAIHVLDSRRWIETEGRNAYSSKMWYLAKVPFEGAVFQNAAADIKCAVRTLSGKSRKLIVLDLDNTLWGGIVGEDGWEKLELGGHGPTGEAHVDFQKGLRALSRRGIALAIASKNTESVALEAIEKHPEMVLRANDFAAWRINWSDKAQNIIELCKELNLGLDSVVFIDDQPAERTRVREALPEVFVPEWPTNRMRYMEALSSLPCFDTAAVTAEDRERSKMYAGERQRRSLLQEVTSMEDWLRDLEIEIQAEELSRANLPRAAQLLNKTNQMNMATRRMKEPEFWEWATAKHHRVWTFRVGDRFGDSGLTGIISLEIDGDTGRIVDLLLSCRVMGRRVEEAMLHTVIGHAIEAGLTRVTAEYTPSPRNQPCLEFLERSGLERDGNSFSWIAGAEFAMPSELKLVLA